MMEPKEGEGGGELVEYMITVTIQSSSHVSGRSYQPQEAHARSKEDAKFGLLGGISKTSTRDPVPTELALLCPLRSPSQDVLQSSGGSVSSSTLNT